MVGILQDVPPLVEEKSPGGCDRNDDREAAPGGEPGAKVWLPWVSHGSHGLWSQTCEQQGEFEMAMSGC